MLQVILLACLVTAVVSVIEPPYGDIVTCGVQYVKPGADFSIPCHTDSGLKTTIYTPSEDVPSNEALTTEAEGDLEGTGKVIITTTHYTDATKGIDDGYYTCVVNHGPEYEVDFSVDKCLVIIEDLCETKNCPETKSCHADYDAGTAECNCEFNCEFKFEAFCSDRCEQFINGCAMKTQTCRDGITRQKMFDGMCSAGGASDIPEYKKIDLNIVEEAGTVITLTSGLITEGARHVTVTWEFTTEDEQSTTPLYPETDPFELTVSEETAGFYTATITTCSRDENAWVNKYYVGLEEELPADFSTSYYTCSVFPGGAIEDFDGISTFYDLACTHVLAADFAPGGDITEPWFIYGSFDNHEGNTALISMTFYLGRHIFEVQRGWVLAIGEEKMVFEEGVEQVVGETECTAMFSFRHIEVKCPQFKAYYDGIMSGHIALLPGVQAPYSPLNKKTTNVGLCYDSDSGFRPNWQIGRDEGECVVDTEAPECPDEAIEHCDLTTPAIEIMGVVVEWTTCGAGASMGCAELHCGGDTPTPAQECALEQARRMSCAVKNNNRVDLAQIAMDAGCPADECEWKEDVVTRGCPQKNLPFVCS